MLLQAAASRLRRHIGDRAGHVELPAVIDASQSAIFVSPEDQRSAAMGTGLVDQPDPALGIPEGHQIFSQEADALRLPVLDEIGRGHKGYPIEADEVSKRRALADPHQSFIVFAREHELSPSNPELHPRGYFATPCKRAATRADIPKSRTAHNGSNASSGFRGIGGSLPASTRLTIISIRRRSSSLSASSTMRPSAVQPGSSG